MYCSERSRLVVLSLTDGIGSTSVDVEELADRMLGSGYSWWGTGVFLRRAELVKSLTSDSAKSKETRRALGLSAIVGYTRGAGEAGCGEDDRRRMAGGFIGTRGCRSWERDVFRGGIAGFQIGTSQRMQMASRLFRMYLCKYADNREKVE